MGRSLIRFFSSYKTTIALLLLYALDLAIATFIEKYASTEAAFRFTYHAPSFFVLQFLLVVNFVLITVRNRYVQQKKWAYLVLHSALVIILAGALTSHLFSKEGIIHLREGEDTNQMLIQTNRGEDYCDLPFNLKLENFKIHYYPGSDSPSSFESNVILTDKKGGISQRQISMNNVLDIHGYRIFQSSYDKDGKGTILSVNKDLLGTSITYTGYACLLLGFLLMFFSKNSRFSYLVRQLRRNKTAAVLILLLFSSLSLSSQEINKEHAAAFGALPMQSFRGRIEPINTFSSEIVRKLHHSDCFGDYNSDQFLLSLLAFPEMYSERPILYLKNKEIAFNYDLSEGFYRFNDLFDSNGNYKLIRDIMDVHYKYPGERSKYEKNLLKLDEQANIFSQLTNYGMLRIFPNNKDEANMWYAPGDDLTPLDSLEQEKITNLFDIYIFSIQNAVETGDWELADKALEAIRRYQEANTSLEIPTRRIELELLYNELNIFKHCKKGYLTLGGFLLVFAFLSLLGKFKSGSFVKTFIEALLIIAIVFTFLLHLGGLITRGYISGHVPWSNAYETMILVSFLTVAAGLIFAYKSRLTLALATLFGGVILFVSGLNWMDPQISPLVPVLKSPWLMTHVASIVAAYGFFGISFLLGSVNLLLAGVQKKKDNSQLLSRLNELTVINEISMLCGLFLMVCGTFIGAIWANESWGRYWGWDPKETWALITIVIYAVILHIRLVKKWDNPKMLNLWAILAFFCVLMTFFGVNYFLSGMHSYA
ncbi:c-type cytochrome biogenesis protein CcsB [Bacteroidales bacterium OttesenSCG-928-A17]|nr:c-type cytochrome biogenesis protein CcsB [Bacteroidales bacterium OttesenSCG-928-A17]